MPTNSSMRICIFDGAGSRAYGAHSIEMTALGGTESTVIRVAKALDALVLQSARTERDGSFLPIDACVSPTHVISLREPSIALNLARRYPRARHYLWLHDLCRKMDVRGKDLRRHARALTEENVQVICVSDFHAAQVKDAFDSLRVKRIYNPVVVDVDATNPNSSTSVDPDKLVYLSSPHKGLRHALRVFQYIRLAIPTMKFFIANPGYNPSLSTEVDGAINLGSLPHAELMGHLQNALCSFLPNIGYPETFGLVMGESNALGVPVLTHRIGAAPEVLENEAQFVPIPWGHIWTERVSRKILRHRIITPKRLAQMSVFDAYIERIVDWREGKRPIVRASELFSLDSVTDAWRAVLCDENL